VVDEDASHQIRGNREKVCAVLPTDAPLVYQPQIGLVDQRGRRKRMVVALAAQVGARDRAQFVVDGVDQLAARGFISVAPRHQQIRYVAIVTHCA